MDSKNHKKLSNVELPEGFRWWVKSDYDYNEVQLSYGFRVVTGAKHTFDSLDELKEVCLRDFANNTRLHTLTRAKVIGLNHLHKYEYSEEIQLLRTEAQQELDDFTLLLQRIADVEKEISDGETNS